MITTFLERKAIDLVRYAAQKAEEELLEQIWFKLAKRYEQIDKILSSDEAFYTFIQATGERRTKMEQKRAIMLAKSRGIFEAQDIVWNIVYETEKQGRNTII